MPKYLVLRHLRSVGSAARIECADYTFASLRATTPTWVVILCIIVAGFGLKGFEGYFFSSSWLDLNRQQVTSGPLFYSVRCQERSA